MYISESQDKKKRQKRSGIGEKAKRSTEQ